MQEWEHHAHLLQLSHSGAIELGVKIEHLGQSGWELVSVIPLGTEGMHAMCFFKRPVR